MRSWIWSTTWGVPRIQSELRLLGYEVADFTVARYLAKRPRRPPSQIWRTFLRNHFRCTAACDFFVVPTVTFRLLYCFVVLAHERRCIVHFNATPHPSAEWTAQQIIEAFPADAAEPKSLLRLSSYQTYDNEARTHLSLERNAPVPREVEPPSKGRIMSMPHLGGLHHRYLRAA